MKYTRRGTALLCPWDHLYLTPVAICCNYSHFQVNRPRGRGLAMLIGVNLRRFCPNLLGVSVNLKGGAYA
ncbi:MAG: hypothetical protein ACYTXC_23250, partial [Nostoc sp.]